MVHAFLLHQLQVDVFVDASAPRIFLLYLILIFFFFCGMIAVSNDFHVKDLVKTKA